MSIARAFTKRGRRGTVDHEDTANAPRSLATRFAPGTIKRNMISLPTELLSTTNVHALNAPDIRKPSDPDDLSKLSIHSTHSDNDFSTIDKGFLTADNSSVEGLSPITPGTPTTSQNELKDFFSAKPVSSQPSAPTIPQRAPSHSKKAHVDLSRKRSIQRMSPPPHVLPTHTTSPRRTPLDSYDSHPFGRELRQVHEIAEEFGMGVGLSEDREEQEMMAKGLRKFSVGDYLDEIAPLFGGVFEDKLSLNPWI